MVKFVLAGVLSGILGFVIGLATIGSSALIFKHFRKHDPEKLCNRMCHVAVKADRFLERMSSSRK